MIYQKGPDIVMERNDKDGKMEKGIQKGIIKEDNFNTQEWLSPWRKPFPFHISTFF